MRFSSKHYIYTSSANIRANSRLKATAIFQTVLFIVPLFHRACTPSGAPRFRLRRLNCTAHFRSCPIIAVYFNIIVS